MTFLSTSEIYDNMHPVSATKYSTIHNDTSKHHVLQNTCHATHPYTPAPQNVACPARTHRDDPKSHARKMQPMLQPNQALQSKIITAPRAHARQPLEVARLPQQDTALPSKMATAPHARAHQPLKMQPAPQRNTTFLSKMTTAPHAHTRQASKYSRHHNETPRYDSKWPPRHTHTHARLQNAARTTTGHHVTIENSHRATGKPSIITWCSRFKKNIYILFFSRAPRYD